MAHLIGRAIDTGDATTLRQLAAAATREQSLMLQLLADMIEHQSMYRIAEVGTLTFDA